MISAHETISFEIPVGSQCPRLITTVVASKSGAIFEEASAVAAKIARTSEHAFSNFQRDVPYDGIALPRFVVNLTLLCEHSTSGFDQARCWRKYIGGHINLLGILPEFQTEFSPFAAEYDGTFSGNVSAVMLPLLHLALPQGLIGLDLADTKLLWHSRTGYFETMRVGNLAGFVQRLETVAAISLHFHGRQRLADVSALADEVIDCFPDIDATVQLFSDSPLNGLVDIGVFRDNR